MSLNVFISAGEPSGDTHAARLMREIKKFNSDINFYGIGGKNMINEGLESFADIKDISVVGFWEVAKKYSFFRNLLEKCKNEIKKRNTDLVIPVDYPGFNFKISGYSKSINIPVIYYIAPQLWAWGKNRAKKLTESVDKLLTVFPFEEDYFKKYGINAEFVGHPLLEDDYIKKRVLSYSERENIIAMLPGSRKQEIQKHMLVFAKIADFISQKLPDYRFVIAKSNSIDEEFYRINSDSKIEFTDNSKELMRIAKSGIIKSGTSNLEAALCGLPFAMVYKTSFFTYGMGRLLINLPWLSIVNILQNKEVVKEFIQNDLLEEKVAENIIDITENENHFNKMQLQFKSIREMLGNKTASKNAAEIISGYLNA
jgi:lipid-A-disaccharide synthase